MELLARFIDLFVHLDTHLSGVIHDYGVWTYLILFLIIFMETGVVITPFLPGDSLLFAAGTLAASGAFDLTTLYFILLLAPFLGDNLNYWIGYSIGPRVFNSVKIPFLKKEYLDRTHEFYEKHGGKTIIIARFLPIIRTFTPFVAGIGRMPYWRFLSYSVFGSLLWVTLFVLGGYFFGNLPVVKENFTIVIFGIIGVSLLPGVIKFVHAQFVQTKNSRTS